MKNFKSIFLPCFHQMHHLKSSPVLLNSQVNIHSSWQNHLFFYFSNFKTSFILFLKELKFRALTIFTQILWKRFEWNLIFSLLIWQDWMVLFTFKLWLIDNLFAIFLSFHCQVINIEEKLECESEKLAMAV